LKLDLNVQKLTAILLQIVYSRDGQTCCMLEPHIVKPMLQRATT